MPKQDYEWLVVIEPLLLAPAHEYDSEIFHRITSFIAAKSNSFLDDSIVLEPFFASYVGLATDYILAVSPKATISADVESAIATLIRYLLKICSACNEGKATYLSANQIVGFIRNLCTGKSKWSDANDILVFSSTLRTCTLPHYIINREDDPMNKLSDLEDDEEQAPSVTAGSVGQEFLSKLNAFTAEVEMFGEVEGQEVSCRQKVASLACAVFNENGGQDILMKCLGTQVYLKRYKDSLDQILSGGDLSIQFGPAEFGTLRNSLNSLITSLSTVSKIVDTPAMLYNHGTVLKELINYGLTCLLLGSSAVLCSANASSTKSADLDQAMCTLAKKTIEVISALQSNIKQNSAIPNCVHVNIKALTSWLIFKTFDSVITRSSVQQMIPNQANSGSNASGSCWSPAAYAFANEGLKCFLSIARDSSPGQVQNKPPAKSTSGRLHEAQKYSISQLNVFQEYTSLDLFRFIPSGSTSKFAGLIMSTIIAMVGKYKSLVEAAKLQPGPSQPVQVPYADENIAVGTTPGESVATTPSVLQQAGAQAFPILRTFFSEEDNSESYSGDLHQLFIEEIKDEVSSKVQTPVSSVSNPSPGQQWIDAATSYVLFMDKYLVCSPTMKSYLNAELCHTRSQQSLSLLAMLLKTTVDDTYDDPSFSKYCIAVKRLCKHFVQHVIQERTAQENFLLMIDLYPDNLTGWPVFAHRHALSLLLFIVLRWQCEPDWGTYQIKVVEMWKHFLDSLLSECVTANHDVKENDDVNVEHCQAMLALLYTLSDENKQQVFVSLAKAILSALDIKSHQLVTMVPLPVTRLFLLLEYMIGYLAVPQNDLLEHVKANIIGDNSEQIMHFHESKLNTTYKKIQDKESESKDKQRQPVFYRLNPESYETDSTFSPIDPIFRQILISAEDHVLNIPEFYTHCLSSMLVGSSLDQAKKSEEITALDKCALQYHLEVVWRVLGLFPPPVTFLLQITDPATLGTQQAALQALRLVPRLKNEEYIRWYKDCYKGSLRDDEIDILIENTISKTASPSFEVQIALHLIQAQMATLMFASESELIPMDQLPGFHNILTLDAVLNETHALLDIHFETIKAAAANKGAEYEEYKILELRKEVERLMPALMLLLGSFTQFVRSALLNQTSKNADQLAAYSQLLFLSSSPDNDAFSTYVVKPQAFTDILNNWNSASFQHYPSAKGWRNSSPTSGAENFTNAVIKAHCRTLSDTAAVCCTVVPLRHLHMTLVRLTCDLNSWFPSITPQEELGRILLPLLFDGSCKDVVADVASCLNQALGIPMVTELKYAYCFRRWHAIMLGLCNMASHLNKKTVSHLISTMSFFIQSCLESPQYTKWLAEFYSSKGDLADVLIVTGSQGCADMASINAILKIFTKLIGLVESGESACIVYYKQLLSTLNKLATVNEKVLQEWLQQVIMASPGDVNENSGSKDAQITSNSMQLRTITAYMIQEDSVVDSAVPRKILNCLIDVASVVLHQTENSQGFQELLVIMSTLAKRGDAERLVSAVVKWLEDSIQYISPECNAERLSLYNELTMCLLSCINDFISAATGKVDREVYEDASVKSLIGERQDSFDDDDETNNEAESTDKLLCTFAETQKEFKQQHWYYCYTCKMTESVGVCAVCVKVCHKDHEVSYAKYGSFFCDCGAKEDKSCLAMAKRQGRSVAQASATPVSYNEPRTETSDIKRLGLASLISVSKDEVLSIIRSSNVAAIITKLILTLEAEYLERYNRSMPQEAAQRVRNMLNKLSKAEKACEMSDTLMAPVNCQETPFENVKPSFGGDQGTTIKQLMNSHMIRREILCKFTVEKPMLAAANDKGKIAILNLADLHKSLYSTSRRPSVARVSIQAVPFTILYMSANPCQEGMLAISGLKECHVLCLTSSGSISKTLQLQPALDTGNFIVKTQWVPGEPSSLAIVTADFIKIYNLLTDVTAPQHHFLLPSGKIRDVTFCLDSESGTKTILVMSSSGHIYTQELNEHSKGSLFYITNLLEIDHFEISTANGRVVLGGGTSIYYSHTLRLLMISFIQGPTFACSIDPKNVTVTQTSKLHFNKGKASSSSQPMVSWSEVYGHPGMLFCITQSTNNPLAVYVTPDAFLMQEVKVVANGKSSSNKGSKILDCLAFRSQYKSSQAITSLLLMCEDGNLKAFRCNEDRTNLWSQQCLNPVSPFLSLKTARKKISAKRNVVTSVQLPVDFFETCEATNDIEFGGNHILEVYNRNQIKQRLSTASQYIACTRPELFKLEIKNTSVNHVLVGVRISVGNHSAGRAPRYVEIFGRKKDISSDGPRWVDFPFTKEECMQAADKITLTFGSNQNTEHVTMIDAIKVYSKTKQSVGWSEEAAANIGKAAPAKESSSKPSRKSKDNSEVVPVAETEEFYCQQTVTPVDRLLSSALNVLNGYFAVMPGDSSPKATIEEFVSKLYKLILPNCVTKSVMSLIDNLYNEKADRITNLYKMNLNRIEAIGNWFSLPVADIDPRTYQLILEWVRHIGHSSKSNLQLLSKCFDDSENFEREFLTKIVNIFKHLYKHRPYHAMLSPACTPGLQDVTTTVCALVEVMFLFVTPEKKELAAYVISLCLEFLFSPDVEVRFSCKVAMTRVLKPATKSMMAPAYFDEVDKTVKPKPEKNGTKPAKAQTPAARATERPRPQQIQQRSAQHHLVQEFEQWLANETMEPTMMDDIELAIALSLQNPEVDDDEDDDEEDDNAGAADAAAVEDEEMFNDDMLLEDEYEALEAEDMNVVIPDEPSSANNNAVVAAADSDLEDPPPMVPQVDSQSVPEAAAEGDSDGGPASGHSSTDLLHSIAHSNEVYTPVTSPAGLEKDKQLRLLVRQEMMSRGVTALESCDGMTAIPFLQVLLELMTDLDTPAEEKALDEGLNSLIAKLVNLKRSAEDLVKRTWKSEVELIVLRLFSVLMSRSHNSQMSAGAKKLNILSASALIRAQVMDLFLPMLKQLLSFWRMSSNVQNTVEESQTIHIPSYLYNIDMSPFFLRQFVKEHPADIFGVLPQLQTEVIVRLMCQLKKLSDANSSELGTLVFCDEWTRVLSEYLGVCEASFIRRQVRKLLSYICGSKESYRRVRDHNTISIKMDAVISAAKTCGLSFDIPTASGLNNTIPYTTLTTMVELLKEIQDVANSRCTNWQQYCSVNDKKALETLMLLGTQIQQTCLSEIIISLIQSAITQPPQPTKAQDSYVLQEGDKDLYKTLTSDLLYGINRDLFTEFVRIYLLSTNQSSIRSQLHALLFNIYSKSMLKDQIELIRILWPLWSQLPQFGKKGDKFVDLLGYMIIETNLPEMVKSHFISGVIDVLSHSNHLLATHQNSNLYNLLQELVDIDGFYLEREPCVTCNDPEIPLASLKLNTIKVDNKFTTTTHLIKLVGSHLITKIHVRITDIKKNKMVKTLSIYYSNRTVQSAVELKARGHAWQIAKKVALNPAQSEVKLDFDVPITACNLMIEYNDFYENTLISQENLPCPRCSASVPANPGICVNCGENVFQCHKCRAINYDEKDPFLCNSCGFCKYGKFDVTLTAKACNAVDSITSEDDRVKTITSVNGLLEKADRTFTEIQTIRSSLERLLTHLSGTKQEPLTINPSSTGHVNKYIQQVANKYCDEAKKQFEELSKIMQKVLMCRQEILQFDRNQSLMATVIEVASTLSVQSQISVNDHLKAEAEQDEEYLNKRLKIVTQSSSRCYGCLTATVTHCITVLQAIATQPFARFDERIIKELVIHNLNSGPMSLRRDSMSLLCMLTKGNIEACNSLYDILYQRISAAMDMCTNAASLAMNIRSEMLMLARSVDSDPGSWEQKMKTVIKLYCKSLQSGKSHVIEAVALTSLEIIKSQIIYSKPTSQRHKDKSASEIAGVDIIDRMPFIDITKWFDGAPGQSFSDWLQYVRAKKSRPSAKPAGRSQNLERKFFGRWREKVKTKRYPSTFSSGAWLTTILFNNSSQNARDISADIIERVASFPQRKLLLVDFLTQLLDKVISEGNNSSSFITLYKSLIKSSDVMYYLVIKHQILAKLAGLVSAEIERLVELEESSLCSDLSLGWGLQALVGIIKTFVDDERIRQKYKGKLVGTVLDGYLSLRKLVIQRTKMIESTQELLLGLLEQLTTGTEAETREFMAVCIHTVSKYSPTDLRSPVFIFERLCSIIRPEESDATEFLIILEKDPQQEDFLQGRMSGNPYTSKEPGLGPLMRDIKNKICTDCELIALLEDDSGMELLVNNKIISLDLTVADVYKKIWQPARENEPMRIVYRMRGLLGDATEDMVNSLESTDAKEEDSEVVFRMASVMQQCGGLDVMLKRLNYIRDYQRGKHLVSVLLKLFDYCLKLQVNRAELIKPERETMSVMLRALNRALRAEQQGQVTQGQGQSITEKVLQVMEVLLLEASHLPPDQYTSFTRMCGDSDQLMLLLDRINSPFVRQNSSVLEALMRLIPFLACGEDEKMATLIDHFKPYLNFLQFDVKHDENHVTYLECFCVITSGIKDNANGSKLKQMMIDQKILADAIDYITVLAPQFKTLLTTDAEDWKEFVGRPCLPYILRLLTGLCARHPPSQELVGESMVYILHKLEHMTSNTQVGSLSENLIETLCQNKKVSEQIKQIRSQSKAEKKRLAMAVRNKQLQSIGMKTNKKGQVVTTTLVMTEAESLKDETGVICSICREGYHNQPNKTLAVYTFSKRVNLEEFETRSRKLQGIFTVSYMNVVHVDCHAAAVRLASSRDEWESASLHNANARCNGLLPLWGPQVQESNFAAALAKHNTYLRECTELRDDSYSLTVHDVKLLLLKFANEQAFSSDGGGGGRNSNMLFVPYELLIALYVINTQRTAKQREKQLQSYWDVATKNKWIESSYDVDGPLYWVVMCLLLWSPVTFKANKLKILERLLVLAQCRSLSPAGATTLTEKAVRQYAVYKPMLVLFGIVCSIYDIMFKNVVSESDTTEWNEALMTFIRNSDVSLAESSEKIIAKYDSELLPCESLSEMFDVLGLLEDVPNPEEWLSASLSSL